MYFGSEVCKKWNRILGLFEHLHVLVMMSELMESGEACECPICQAASNYAEAVTSASAHVCICHSQPCIGQTSLSKSRDHGCNCFGSGGQP
jgi:hypothetical protein